MFLNGKEEVSGHIEVPLATKDFKHDEVGFGCVGETLLLGPFEEAKGLGRVFDETKCSENSGFGDSD